MCLQTSAMAEATINLMLSLIVINPIHFVCLQTSAMTEAAINLMLSLIVINTIHVCVFTDIHHGRGRHKSDVRVSYLSGRINKSTCSALSTHVLSSLPRVCKKASEHTKQHAVPYLPCYVSSLNSWYKRLT